MRPVESRKVTSRRSSTLTRVGLGGAEGSTTCACRSRRSSATSRHRPHGRSADRRADLNPAGHCSSRSPDSSRQPAGEHADRPGRPASRREQYAAEWNRAAHQRHQPGNDEDCRRGESSIAMSLSRAILMGRRSPDLRRLNHRNGALNTPRGVYRCGGGQRSIVGRSDQRRPGRRLRRRAHRARPHVGGVPPPGRGRRDRRQPAGVRGCRRRALRLVRPARGRQRRAPGAHREPACQALRSTPGTSIPT